ncbi:MAG TPA: DUF427 domain-containing protein [Gaiellaceae bacterium]|nr:DUF427 domain-containing protein [Gaiellaceae bacterium]
MRFTGVSPVLLSSDLERSIAFYEQELGFTGERYGDDFAIVSRDGQSIFLARTEAEIVPHWHVVEKMWNAYVRVDHVDAYYEEVQKRGSEIDYELYDAPHGMREFGVTDPDGHDVAFGQPILRWEPAGVRVRVLAGSETIADTVHASVLYEIGHEPVYYIPEADVRRDLLEPSDHHTHCPRKGDASYWSLPGIPNAIWYYPEPIAAAAFIAGHVAFYRQHVTVEVGG